MNGNFRRVRWPVAAELKSPSPRGLDGDVDAKSPGKANGDGSCVLLCSRTSRSSSRFRIARLAGSNLLCRLVAFLRSSADHVIQFIQLTLRDHFPGKHIPPPVARMRRTKVEYCRTWFVGSDKYGRLVWPAFEGKSLPRGNSFVSGAPICPESLIGWVNSLSPFRESP
jgi:hypothetical protein